MTWQEAAKRLQAAYDVAQWAKHNGFDTIEIMWLYEAAIEEVVEGTSLIGKSPVALKR